jgi:hypothetical protein
VIEKISMVCNAKGIAIHKMVNGFSIMTFPLNENSKVNVNNKAIMVIGVKI